MNVGTSFELARRSSTKSFFFFNDTATTEIYTLSLHDALPICLASWFCGAVAGYGTSCGRTCWHWLYCANKQFGYRSEEHTSELQSLTNLVCRLLLEKKKKPYPIHSIHFSIPYQFYYQFSFPYPLPHSPYHYLGQDTF